MRKTNKGLLLNAKRTIEQGRWIRSMAVCGAVLAALAGITDYAQPKLLIAAGMLSCLLLRGGGWRLAALLGGMLLLTVSFRQQALNGFCLFWNRLGDVYTAGTGIVIPELATNGEEQMVFTILTGMAAGIIVSAMHGWEWLLLVLCAALAATFRQMPEMTVWMALSLILLMKPNRERFPKLLLPMGLLLTLLFLGQVPIVQEYSASCSSHLRELLHTVLHQCDVLPEGRISEGIRTDEDQTTLVVTLEKPETLYLRGFTGATLEENTWHPLDASVLQEQENLLYWINQKEFHLLAQLDGAAMLEHETNTVTIQNVGACTAWRYLPFTLCADDRLSAQAISPDTAPGTGDYDRFTTVYRGAEQIPQILELLASSREEPIQNYIRAEAAYREFITENYLQVSIDDHSAAWSQFAGEDPQQAVLHSLQRLYPDGPERSAKYATDTVLTLRHFGIPARYAEGYIVPESESATIRLTAANAACWAEVYQEGIGWMPMAMTPGLLESEPEQKPEQTPTEPPDEPTAETVPQEDPQPDSGWQVRIAKVLRTGLLWVLVLVLLFASTLYLRRKWILKKRHSLFQTGDPTEAVGWIFTDVVHLLEQMGIHPGIGSLDPLEDILRERFGAELADHFRICAALNAKSLFSSKKRSEEDRRTLLDLHQQIQTLLNERSAWHQRLWMRWILCLF